MRWSFLRGCLRSLSLVILYLAFAAHVPAQQCDSKDGPDDRGRLVVNFLDQRLAVWQQRLSLADWKLSIVMSPSGELRPGTMGNIRWDADKKSAVIRVLRASEYKLNCSQMLKDMEFTLVHELIHLELASLPRDEASRRVEEHAVNRIAKALLKLDRPEPSRGDPR